MADDHPPAQQQQTVIIDGALEQSIIDRIVTRLSEEGKLPGPRLTILPRPGHDGVPPGPGDRIVEMRIFANDAERQMGQKAMADAWPHLSAKSTLVVVIGNHYHERSWNKIADMVKFTNDKGIRCGFSEIQDRCFAPYDALGTMRNEALLKALYEGWDYICYLDADVQPEPDALWRLLQHEMPIMAPFVAEPGTGRPLHGPVRAPNSGLQPVKWCVLTMLVIKTSVFHCFQDPGAFWADAMGADEGFHFQKLWYYGHRPWLDTNVQLLCSDKPHYPLASLRFTRAEYDVYWNDVQEKRKLPPNRKAIDPASPFIVDGEYNPFVQPNQPLKPPPAAPNGHIALPSEIVNTAR